MQYPDTERTSFISNFHTTWTQTPPLKSSLALKSHDECPHWENHGRGRKSHILPAPLTLYEVRPSLVENLLSFNTPPCLSSPWPAVEAVGEGQRCACDLGPVLHCSLRSAWNYPPWHFRVAVFKPPAPSMLAPPFSCSFLCGIGLQLLPLLLLMGFTPPLSTCMNVACTVGFCNPLSDQKENRL